MVEGSYQRVYLVHGDDRKAALLVGGRVYVAAVKKLFHARKIFVVETSDKAPSLLLNVNAAPDGLSHRRVSRGVLALARHVSP
eukprot:m51a1_g13448 hypothetical protein (83) ;mRNA; r:1043-1291